MNKLNKLLSARFIVVLLTTFAFCYLAITNNLTVEYTTVYMTIINYYFYKERIESVKTNKDK